MHSIFRELGQDTISTGILGIGPKTSAALVVSAAAGAAYTMGATWLGTSIVGLPLGFYLIAGSVIGAHWLRRRFGAAAMVASHNDHMPSHTPFDTRTVVAFRNPPKAMAKHDQNTFERWSSPLAAGALELAESSARQYVEVKRRVGLFADKISGAHAGLRIGIDLADKEYQAVCRSLLGNLDSRKLVMGGVPVELTRAESGLLSAGAADAAKFDALIRRAGDGRLAVFVAEDDRSPAAWFDWGMSLPLSYLSVFPARLDCATINFGQLPALNDAHARVVGALAIASAVLSRTPARLGNARMLSRSTLPDSSLVLAAAMNLLAESLLSSAPESGRADGASRAAARVLSAYVSTGGVDLPSGDRAHLAEIASSVLPGDAEITLRLGAVQLAAGQNVEGSATLIRALRQLRVHNANSDSDALACAVNEVELGLNDRMSFGRVCAGVCLAIGTAPSDASGHLRDDLIDDLKHAGWMLGHEADLTLLRDLITSLEAESNIGRTSARLAA